MREGVCARGEGQGEARMEGIERGWDGGVLMDWLEKVARGQPTAKDMTEHMICQCSISVRGSLASPEG